MRRRDLVAVAMRAESLAWHAARALERMRAGRPRDDGAAYHVRRLREACAAALEPDATEGARRG